MPLDICDKPKDKNKQTNNGNDNNKSHTHKALAVSKYPSDTECSKVLPIKLKTPQTT